jgi:uncharacterized protein YggE
MSLTGTGTVKAKPDEGYITVGVTTYGQKSADAVSANTKTMKALYKTLSEKGIKEEGLQTLDFSVSEHYKTVYEKDEETGKKVPKQVKDGYVVNNVVHVTCCDLERFGEVLDAVTSSGANSVHGISFGSSKSKDLLNEARRKAVADALEKAKFLTDGLGVKLGRVMNINEGYVNKPRPLYAAANRAEAASAGDVPVSGGSLTFSVSVNVTWELSQNPVVGQRKLENGAKQLFVPVEPQKRVQPEKQDRPPRPNRPKSDSGAIRE